MNKSKTDVLQGARNIPTSQIGEQINLLHANIIETTETTRVALRRTIESAWHAGGLLQIAKKRAKIEGRLGWGLWIEENFSGSYATAHRYIQLY